MVFYFTLSLQAWASSGIIKQGLGATLVCPFTVTGAGVSGKSIGVVYVSCFSDTACTTYTGDNASWGGRGGTPTLKNGSHTLSNDAMASVGLPAACAAADPTTASIQLQVQNPSGSVTALLCMQAIVVSGIFTCTNSGTLDISGL